MIWHYLIKGLLVDAVVYAFDMALPNQGTFGSQSLEPMILIQYYLFRGCLDDVVVYDMTLPVQGSHCSR